jgi:hypothetical protein
MGERLIVAILSPLTGTTKQVAEERGQQGGPSSEEYLGEKKYI